MKLFNSRPSISFSAIEKDEWKNYIDIVCQGMTIFDVGANAGELSILFSHFTGKNGYVHAFEPTPATFHKLNAVSRSVRNKNLIPNNMALADVPGKIIKLHVYEDEYSGLNTSANRPLKEHGFNIEPVDIINVQCDTIDAYCVKHNIEQIDLLKIDVEGAELDVLKGAERLLNQKQIKTIVYEFGQTTLDMGHNREEFMVFFNENNYKIQNLMKKHPPMPGKDKFGKQLMSLNIAKPR